MIISTIVFRRLPVGGAYRAAVGCFVGDCVDGRGQGELVREPYHTEGHPIECGTCATDYQGKVVPGRTAFNSSTANLSVFSIQLGSFADAPRTMAPGVASCASECPEIIVDPGVSVLMFRRCFVLINTTARAHHRYTKAAGIHR